jgi:hypothetical protein
VCLRFSHIEISKHAKVLRNSLLYGTVGGVARTNICDGQTDDEWTGQNQYGNNFILNTKLSS